MIFLTSMLLVAAIYVATFFRTRQALRALEWAELAQRVTPLSRQTRMLLVTCDERFLAYTGRDAWDVIGGLRGLLVLYRNVEAMLDLAVYAESWTGEIGVLLAQRIRNDAVDLRRAIGRFCLAYLISGSGEAYEHALRSMLFVYRQAASRIVTLYETTHAGLSLQVCTMMNGPS